MSPNRPFVLVVNPRAAAGRAEGRVPEIEAALREAGDEFETRPTRGPRDATRIVREALAEGASGIAVVGGDGTFSEAADGFFTADGELVETDAWLGPIPVGTGGDFSRTLAIRDDPIGAAARLLTREPRAIDCGYVRFVDHDGQPASRAFLNIASFGVAGLVDKLVNEGPKWMGGTPAFLLGTARALRRYRPQHVRIVVDGAEPVEEAITNIAVANGRYFGGGMHVAPEAEIDDGLLDIVTIGKASLATQAMSFRRMYDGRIRDAGHVTYRQGKRVVAEPVDADEHVLLDIDGEAPGRLPATLELRPHALRIRA